MKKLSILLAVVVLLAAVGIGVLVNRNNQSNAKLTAAETLAKDTQTLLDEQTSKTTEAEAALAQAKEELETAKAEAETAATDLAGQLDTAKAEFEAKEVEYLAKSAELTQQAKDADAKVLGLRLLLDNAKADLSAAESKSTELLGLVDTTATEKGQLNTTLDQAIAAKAQLDGLVAELEATIAQLTKDKDEALAKVADLEAQVKEFETVKAEAQAEMDKLSAQTGTLSTDMEAALKANAELDAAKVLAENKVTELEGARKELEDRIVELEAAALETQQKLEALETERGELLIKADELTNDKATLEARVLELETPAETAAVEAGFKHGLGMVTSIDSIADATDEKPGSAQVNTAVCSLVLDPEGKIASVTWDMQQTKITFSNEGKPVNLPENLLTKLEKGADYGMAARSPIGKEWDEQIKAFAQYAIGKTVDEVLGIATTDLVDGGKVADVEELKSSVTIGLGDYLAVLQKAAENAK